MANALALSRMVLASARAFPARRSALQAAGGGGAFGARMPASRMLGERRLFAYPPSNGNGRGSHTSTAAVPNKKAATTPSSAASAAKAKQAEQPTELTFAPFDEVKKPLEELREAEGHDVSLAREEGYVTQLEDAVNQQINVELTIRRVATMLARSRARTMRGRAGWHLHRRPASTALRLLTLARGGLRSHIYHSMYAYFDRDNVALRGLARYFRKVSNEEREHAEGLMDFQNRRGGHGVGACWAEPGHLVLRAGQQALQHQRHTPGGARSRPHLFSPRSQRTSSRGSLSSRSWNV
jgi:hypothetical protein